MEIIESHQTIAVFETYPKVMRKKLLLLRQLIFNVAVETKGVDKLEETLKWGEPSYLSKKGSTVRLGWKRSDPKHYAVFFNCKTTLLDTFKEIYRDTFKFEGNRAIIFNETDDIPIQELKHCISLSLTYHSRKHLPMLGI